MLGLLAPCWCHLQRDPWSLRKLRVLHLDWEDQQSHPANPEFRDRWCLPWFFKGPARICWRGSENGWKCIFGGKGLKKKVILYVSSTSVYVIEMKWISGDHFLGGTNAVGICWEEIQPAKQSFEQNPSLFNVMKSYIYVPVWMIASPKQKSKQTSTHRSKGHPNFPFPSI